MLDATAVQAHGGMLHEELSRLGLAPEAVLDVSVNVNPYGPCPSVLEAIRSARIERYPDPTAAPARAALAAWLDVAVDRVVVGNGAVDLLWSLARCRVGPGDTVLIVEPAFSELRSAAGRVGARVVEHRLEPGDDFRLDLDALDAALRRERPRLAYVCTPANPTGRSVPIDALARLSCAHRETTLIVDLSFASLSADYQHDACRASDRIVWLRSLTKDLALAGLRVGFAVAPAHVARAIESSRPPWSVNALAQAAAIAATEPRAQVFVAESRARLLADRQRHDLGLRRLGLRVHPSETLYTLVDLGPERSATALRDGMLARHAVLVRDGTSFGLPHHLRLCARPPPETARMLLALEREVGR